MIVSHEVVAALTDHACPVHNHNVIDAGLNKCRMNSAKFDTQLQENLVVQKVRCQLLIRRINADHAEEPHTHWGSPGN